MNKEIVVSARRVKQKKKHIKIAKLLLLTLILLLLIIYIVIRILYNNGTFCVSLDKNLYFEKNIIIYDNPDYKVYRTELYAETLETFDNISYKWLPEDIDDYEGSNNGDNYMAYSFYVENIGTAASDYWSEIIIDDVIKRVDEAIRIRVYRNGEPITYAKIGANGEAEDETVAFKSDTLVSLNHVEDFAPGEIDKYTVVMWLEGSDPECVDNIIGGEIQLHMKFNSEFIEK